MDIKIPIPAGTKWLLKVNYKLNLLIFYTKISWFKMLKISHQNTNLPFHYPRWNLPSIFCFFCLACLSCTTIRSIFWVILGMNRWLTLYCYFFYWLLRPFIFLVLLSKNKVCFFNPQTYCRTIFGIEHLDLREKLSHGSQ